jgi:hypothetical protein
LESAHVKLAAVLRPLLGVSGRAILAALAAGETDPDRLVALAHPRLRAKRAALRAALPGHVRPHHRVLLQQHLRVVETLQATIAELDAAIAAARRTRPPVGRRVGEGHSEGPRGLLAAARAKGLRTARRAGGRTLSAGQRSATTQASSAIAAALRRRSSGRILSSVSAAV